MKANLVKKLVGWNGDARLYKVEPAVKFAEASTADYVVVSSVNGMFAHETYIFPSDENGNVIYWGELDGSTRGECSHDDALRAGGYEVAE